MPWCSRLGLLGLRLIRCLSCVLLLLQGKKEVMACAVDGAGYEGDTKPMSGAGCSIDQDEGAVAVDVASVAVIAVG